MKHVKFKKHYRREIGDGHSNTDKDSSITYGTFDTSGSRTFSSTRTSSNNFADPPVALSDSVNCENTQLKKLI
jgi:hypothetical protein